MRRLAVISYPHGMVDFEAYCLMLEQIDAKFKIGYVYYTSPSAVATHTSTWAALRGIESHPLDKGYLMNDYFVAHVTRGRTARDRKETILIHLIEDIDEVDTDLDMILITAPNKVLAEEIEVYMSEFYESDTDFYTLTINPLTGLPQGGSILRYI